MRLHTNGLGSEALSWGIASLTECGRCMELGVGSSFSQQSFPEDT